MILILVLFQASEVIGCALDQFFPESAHPSLQVIATPGRFFAAPAFSLCTTVIGKQLTPAHRITNDGELGSGPDS